MKIPKEIMDRLHFRPGKLEGDPQRIVQIDHALEQCADCDQWLDQGRQLQMTKSTKPCPHWRTKCCNCNQWRNPITGAYDSDWRGVQAAYRDYLKNQK